MAKTVSRRRQVARATAATAATASSNTQHQPIFNVFALPFDLKEYLSRFFQPSEAVKLLRVCTEFHAIFSQSVWRDMRLLTLSTGQLPAWRRYGHLIRVLIIDSPLPAPVRLAEIAPNVMVLKFVFVDSESSMVSTRQLDELRNVQKVHASVDIGVGAFPSDFIEWVGDSSRSGNVRSFVWTLDAYGSGDPVPWQILSNLSDLQRHRFDVTAKLEQPSIPSILQPVLPFASFFSVGSEYSEVCAFTALSALFSSQASIHFQHLKRLVISTDYVDDAVLGFPDFQPAAFPSLDQFMVYNSPRNSSIRIGAHLQRMFSQPWPRLLIVHFYGHIKSKELDKILEMMPNVTEFVLSVDVDAIDLGIIQRRLRRLVKLRLTCRRLNYSPPAQVSSSMSTSAAVLATSCVRFMDLIEVTVSVDALRFILIAAPVLGTLKLEDCRIEDDAVKYAIRQSSKLASAAKNDGRTLISLMSVGISSGDMNPIHDSVVDLLAAFTLVPKIRVLASTQDRQYIRERYPTLKF